MLFASSRGQLPADVLIAETATALGAASGKAAQSELRKLLRSMNAYYTNRIEGALWPEAEQDQALLEGEVGLGSPSRDSGRRKHPG